MTLFADGGLLASKPYAASGAYIQRMSDYCSGCRYDAKIKFGPSACPCNYLNWHFLIVNEDRLKPNPRMAMPYRTLARMTAERRQQVTQQRRHSCRSCSLTRAPGKTSEILIDRLASADNRLTGKRIEKSISPMTGIRE